ncbi:hydrolase [Pseudohyphozyma bogoriensis]|nr:hydrolase [Pseudohyphozyma bogoriensis]
MLTLHLVEAGTPPSAFLGLYGQVNIGGEFYNIPKPDDVLLGLSPRRPMDELQHLFGAGRTPVVGTDVEFFRTRVEDIKPEDRLLYDQTNLCSNLFYNGVAADAFTGSTGLSKALGALPGITHDLEAQRRTIPQEKHHFFPLLRLTPSFPPTLIFHGEKDIAIPISDSEVFYGELERNRVDSRFVRVVGEGSGHGFDRQNFEHWYEAYLRDNTLWLLSKV